MSQEAAKINVKHVASRLQHDVVIVSVTDAQDVRGHTAASTGIDEVLHGLEEKREIGEDIKLVWKDSMGTAKLNSTRFGFSLVSPNSISHLPVQPSSWTSVHTDIHRFITCILQSMRRWKASMCISTTLSEIHLPLHLSFSQGTWLKDNELIQSPNWTSLGRDLEREED